MTLATALIWLGCALLLLSAVGLLRMPDPYMRMHAAAKAATLGSATLVAGVGLELGDPASLVRAGLIAILLVLTTPLGAILLASAALGKGVRPAAETQPDEYTADAEAAE